jgi:hypothetical protein
MEVATSAFAICSILTYPFVFPKPKDATIPIALGALKDIIAPELHEMKRMHEPSPLPLRILGRTTWTSYRSFVMMAIIAACFGAIHVACGLGPGISHRGRCLAMALRFASLATLLLPVLAIPCMFTMDYVFTKAWHQLVLGPIPSSPIPWRSDWLRPGPSGPDHRDDPLHAVPPARLVSNNELVGG